MRRFLSSAFSTFGIVWAAAGIFKYVFGTQLTLPLLPPLGLESVAAGPSIAIGFGLFVIGAIIERAANRASNISNVEASDEGRGLLREPFESVPVAEHQACRQPQER